VVVIVGDVAVIVVADLSRRVRESVQLIGSSGTSLNADRVYMSLYRQTKYFIDHHPMPSFLPRAFCSGPNHALNPMASFCLDSLRVKSQN
jgi:hypothetical protein